MHKPFHTMPSSTVVADATHDLPAGTHIATRRKMIRYRVRPECAEENVGYVKAVFAELNTARPAGVRYTTSVLDDGVTFVHLVEFDAATDDALTSLPSFKAFVNTVRARCDELPATTHLSALGSYGW